MSLKKLAKYILNKLPIRLRCLIQSVHQAGKVAVGCGLHIHSSAHLLGKGNIRVGSNTCVGEGCWLNVNHRRENKVSIEIGNNRFILKHNLFTSGDMISICEYTLKFIGCKFIGSTHKVDNPEVPYLLTATICDDQIKIGVNCFLGAGSTALGNVKVGHGSVIDADSLVLRNIPPFSIAIRQSAKNIFNFL